MSQRTKGGYARVESGPVKRIVVGMWCAVASLAPVGCTVCMLLDHLAHQCKYTSYNVAYYDFSRLRRRQPPAYLFYALNELRCISSLELAHYA